MRPKRGIIVTLLILVIVSGTTIAEERYGQLNGGAYDACESAGDCCRDGNIRTVRSADPNPPVPNAEGCRFRVKEHDPFDDDERTFSLQRGTTIYTWPQFISDESELPGYRSISTDYCDTAALVHGDRWQGDGGSYICGSQNWWYKCTEANAEGAEQAGELIYMPGGQNDDTGNIYAFKCVIDDDMTLPAWSFVGIDNDGDGFSTEDDCIDRPLESDPEICREVESADDCNNVKYSACAICINPGAPEVCGDGIDNDCNPSTSPLPDTDCHSFQAGCEQISLHQARTGQIPGADIDEITGEPIPQEERNPQKNIYNKQFDWLDTDDGGYCCGYNDITDVGSAPAVEGEEAQPLCPGE